MARYQRIGGGGRVAGAFLATALAVGAAGGCEPVTGNGPLRFGQSGEVRITVESPLYLGAGWLHQVLTWRSDGAWKLFEEIGYREIVGDEHLVPNPGLPFQYASLYASLIQKLNDDEGFKLIGYAPLDAVQDPQCPPGMSRVTVRIYDESGREGREWTRCANGSLTNLTTQGSGPDVAASRVIQAAIFVRNNTVGSDFASTYAGSLPFGTLDRGTETGSGLDAPRYFRTLDGADPGAPPEDFDGFWADHFDPDPPPLPDVDWDREMVLVAAVGVRYEVGDSVEIRRVLAIDSGTRVEWVERRPGDFCAPARRNVRPIQIVIAPRSPAPVEFAELPPEAVPCGT